MLTHSSSLDEPKFNFPFNMFFWLKMRFVLDDSTEPPKYKRYKKPQK